MDFTWVGTWGVFSVGIIFSILLLVGAAQQIIKYNGYKKEYRSISDWFVPMLLIVLGVTFIYYSVITVIS